MDHTEQNKFNPFSVAREILEETQKNCRLKFGFEIPLTFDFNLRSKTAVGQATSILGDPSKNKISLSRMAVEQMSFIEIKDLVIHEFAHLLCRKLYPQATRSHGKDWKKCVYSLGGTNVSPTQNNTAIKLNKDDVLVKCKCEQKYKFVPQKVAKNIEKGDCYLCSICHKKLKLAKTKDFIKFDQLKGEKNEFRKKS